MLQLFLNICSDMRVSCYPIILNGQHFEVIPGISEVLDLKDINCHYYSKAVFSGGAVIGIF